MYAVVRKASPYLNFLVTVAAAVGFLGLLVDGSDIVTSSTQCFVLL